MQTCYLVDYEWLNRGITNSSNKARQDYLAVPSRWTQHTAKAAEAEHLDTLCTMQPSRFLKCHAIVGHGLYAVVHHTL